MTYIASFFLGLVQGAAEFLPISSSGHLAIAQNLLGLDTEVPVFFDVLLHLGTLAAVFVVYWSDIVAMVREFFLGIRDLKNHTTPQPVPPARRMILLLIVGSLPLFLILPFHEKIQALSGNMTFVGAALIFTGLALFLSDLSRRKSKTDRNATVLDAILVGLGQTIATFPGVSRSGMTISTGCYVGFERSFAVRFSFLLSIPAVIAANLLSLVDALKAGIDMSDFPKYLVGVLTAALVGYLCLRILKFVARRGRFGAFAYYCWALGLLTLTMSIIK